MFLLVPAYPGCPGSKAVKRLSSDLYHSVTSNMWRHRKTLTYLHTHTHAHAHMHTHTHTFIGTRKVKPIWILLKQETVYGSGIRWAMCKAAPYSRQTTTPAPPPLLCVFTGRMPFLSPNQQCQSTEGILTYFSSNASRAILTNGHTGHVPRAPGFFFFLRAPSGCGKINF